MEPFYGQNHFPCPMDSRYICPFSNTVDASILIQQRPQDVNQMMGLIDREFANHYSELQRYGVPRGITRNLFRSVVSYVLVNEKNYSGTIDQKTNQLFNAIQRDLSAVFYILRIYGVPNNRINQIIRDIIRFILENISAGPVPPATGWSEWEDLGGILTSAPAVASWQANRLDVFGRGQNQALWHKYWDGRRWSEWEDLGGVLTSAPTVASWGPNRLDVFGRGQNQALWHKYWDGRRWSEWEDLGGVLTSAPAAVSWGPNRIDVFGKGQNQSLWHKYWDGRRWSEWEDLGGGSIQSGPGVASTGVNRLEVFAQGSRDQLLFRTWNGNRWSGWQSLGGVITSEPAAVSWGGNRLDVFARGQNNHLWHIWRP